jgi:hypothetical protein
MVSAHSSLKNLRLPYSTNASGGPLVRIGPNEVMSSNPSDWRKVLSARGAYIRSDWFDTAILGGQSNIVAEQNDHVHSALRAKIAAGVTIHLNTTCAKS